jgi:DNA-directed RNA polymerase specialized sigma24 family protein
LQITVNDSALSQDLVHEVYLRFIQKEKGLTGLENAEGYVFSALKNAYRSSLRTKSRYPEISISDEPVEQHRQLATDPRSSAEPQVYSKVLMYLTRQRGFPGTTLLSARPRGITVNSEVPKTLRRTRTRAALISQTEVP